MLLQFQLLLRLIQIHLLLDNHCMVYIQYTHLISPGFSISVMRAQQNIIANNEPSLIILYHEKINQIVT